MKRREANDGRTYAVTLFGFCGMSQELGAELNYVDALKIRGRAVRKAYARGGFDAPTLAPGGAVELTDDGSGMIPDDAGYYAVRAWPRLVSCAWCGMEYQPERPIGRERSFCSECCAAADNGQECACVYCETFRAEETPDDDGEE